MAPGIDNRKKKEVFVMALNFEELVQIVFMALGKYISQGEFEDILAQMPLELKTFFHESLKH